MEGFTGLTLFKCLLSVAVQTVKNLLVMQETQGLNLGWEDPLEKGMGPTPVFGPGEVHGLYRPWGCKESDTTERLEFLPWI